MKNILFTVFTLFILNCFSQIKIGENPNNINPSALFEAESTSKGFLPPRMTSAQRDAIQSPAAGLRIFNLTTSCENYFNGVAWYELCGNCVLPLPNTPSSIIGSTTVCSGNSYTYSVNPVQNATSYIWQFPTGWTVTAGAGTNSVTVLPNSTPGNVSCQASNLCGNSSVISSSISSISPPNTPTASTITPSQNQITWQWNSSANATSYIWNSSNNSNTATSLGNTTTLIQTGLNCNTQRTIYVWASNSCGLSSPLSLLSQTLPCCNTFTGTLANGLLSYHKMCGNLNDISGNGRHGQNPNSLALTQDKNNVSQYAYQLQQSNSNFDFPSPGVSDYTISIWVKPTSTQANVDIIQFLSSSAHGEHSQTIRTNQSGFFEHRLWHGGDATVTSSTLTQPNTWYHLVATAKSGSQMKFFINGVQVGSAPINSIWTLGNMFRVGKSNRPGANNSFTGTIDEIGVWNRELTNAEVTTLYNSY
jgi:hypothetical protein